MKKSQATAFAVLALAATAHAATWTGANGTDLADPLNWDGDTATEPMMFTGDASTTLSRDLTVYGIFKHNAQSDSDLAGRTVVFDLGGHTLTSTNHVTNSSGDIYVNWRINGTTYRFTNGTILNLTAAGVTNTINIDQQWYPNARFEVAGTGAKFVGSIVDKARREDNSAPWPDFRFRVIDGAEAAGAKFVFGSVGSTNEVSNGSTLRFSSELHVGSQTTSTTQSGSNGGLHDNLLTVSGSTLSGSEAYVGHGGNTARAGSRDNRLVAKDGSTVSVSTLNIGTYGPNTNNAVEVRGAGTTLAVGDVIYIGMADTGSTTRGGPCGNELVVADGAAATLYNVEVGTMGGVPSSGNRLVAENGGNVRIGQHASIGTYGTNNALVVKSGATVDTEPSVNFYLGDKGNHFGSAIDVDGGALTVSSAVYVGMSGNSGGEVVSVSNGGTFSPKNIVMYGVGATLSVSNGTITATTINTGAGAADSHNIVRVAGADSLISFTTWFNGQEYPHGAPVFEFVVPEDGWAAAPILCSRAFTLPANVTLRLDEASVKAFRRKLAARGIDKADVPLMRTSKTTNLITVDNMTVLSANLPGSCSLKSEDGVLSVRITASPPTVLSVR